ncbi:MAG: helix-hairpin-helix domain-containing protein [Saprospiraceae bacterium]
MDKLYTEQAYLSKKERLGVLILCIILLLCTIVPYLFNKSKLVVHESSVQGTSNSKQVKDTISFMQHDVRSSKGEKIKTSSLISFSKFDPNSLNAQQAKQLGIPKKTFAILEKFRNKGFKFKKAEDLKKVYGLSEQLYLKLLPFIEIPGTKSDTLKTVKENFKAKFNPIEIKPIEINSASQEEWISLKGIGEKLADRIIKFKNSLGGFHSVDQIGEVYGIADSILRQLKPQLVCNPSIVPLNVNSSDIDELNAHPYIDYKQALFIVNYRRQHGRIKSLEELMDSNYFKKEWKTKLEPYLNFGE